MNRPSLAVLISSLSALSFQAAANEVINIEKAKVSDDLAMAIKSQFSQIEPTAIAHSHFVQFCSTLNIDGDAMDVDVEAFLTSNKDSTSVGVNTSGFAQSAGSCYNNCYNNCHGSRSWR